MKAGKAHTVPLSPAALDVFKRAATLRIEGTDLVFHGSKRGKPLSDMTLLKVLRDQGEPYTVHGFRSSFRDWVADQTNVQSEVAEAALAHAIPNKVEAAYKRTDFFEKRRKLMDAWGAYCAGESNKVVRLHA
jgi:integrase